MLEVSYIFFPKSFLYFYFFIVPSIYNPQEFNISCPVQVAPHLIFCLQTEVLHVHMY